jgi:L-histidine Nalpha-methyltransferase
VRKDDLLLLSANLAPGSDYMAGVQKILPLYDNALTRRWLATSLLDAGLDISPDDIEFSIREVQKVLRVEANYKFREPQSIRIGREQFDYEVGEDFRLFFSYRHTPDRLETLLARFGIAIQQQWLTPSGDEGIFLCRKTA